MDHQPEARAALCPVEAIQAQQKMVNSPNHTEVYIPVGPMGVPVVGTMKLGQEGKQ
jgi:hypothetical protein